MFDESLDRTSISLFFVYRIEMIGCIIAVIVVIALCVVLYIALSNKTGMRLGGGEKYIINEKEYEASSQEVEKLLAVIKKAEPGATQTDVMEAAVLVYETFIRFMKMFRQTTIGSNKQDPPSEDLARRLHEDQEALFVWQHGDMYDLDTKKQRTQLPDRILFMVALMKEAKDIAGGRKQVTILPGAPKNRFIGNAFATLQAAWQSVAHGNLMAVRDLTPFASSELATEAYIDKLKYPLNHSMDDVLIPRIHKFNEKFSYIGRMEDIPLNDIVFKGECLKTLALGFEKVAPHLGSKKPAFTNIDGQITKIVDTLAKQGRVRVMNECILPSLTEMAINRFGPPVMMLPVKETPADNSQSDSS